LKKAGILLLFLAVMNIGLWFFYLPYQEKGLMEEFNIYKNFRDKHAKDSLGNFEDIYRAKDKLGEFEKQLRVKKDFPKLITYLFDRSAASATEINSVTYNFEEKKDLALTKLSLSISISGKYENIRRFIYGMESGSHLFEISGLKMMRQGAIVSASMVLTTYLKANP
jgi:Tfp pilus assembly protein PilO